MLANEDKLAHVLFSTAAEDLGLYGKPMARNAQIWTHDFRCCWTVRGPRPTSWPAAAERLAEGGLFGYRMLYPAMRVGRHEVYWHRPLVAYFDPRRRRAGRAARRPAGLSDGLRRPTGRGWIRPVELWPRLLARPLHQAALRLFTPTTSSTTGRRCSTSASCSTPGSCSGGGRCRQLRPAVAHPAEGRVAGRLAAVAAGGTSADGAAAGRAAALLEPSLRGGASDGAAAVLRRSRRRPARTPHVPPPSLTLRSHGPPVVREAYWKTIARLAAGRYVNKDNADCVHDAPTPARGWPSSPRPGSPGRLPAWPITSGQSRPPA